MSKKYSIGKYTASVLLAGTIAFGPATAGSVFAHGAPDADANNATTEVDSGNSNGAGIPILTQGEQGPDVTDVQEKLQNHGYDVKTDGIYDQNLQNKIVDFQYAQGWDADGVMDQPTMDALNNGVATASYSSNDSNADESNTPKNLSTDNDASGEPDANAGDAVSVANSLVGSPYVMGGTTPAGFDSSGFIDYVFEQQGVDLSRTHEGMWANDGVQVSNPQPGDVVFFENTYKPGVSHSGIYLGNDKMIHAGTEQTGVEVTSMDIDYWANKYIGAKRF